MQPHLCENLQMSAGVLFTFSDCDATFTRLTRVHKQLDMKEGLEFDASQLMKLGQ